MSTQSFTIRSMRSSDTVSGLRLSDAEGWNQTEKDWKLFVENPKNICAVAEADNQVIGTTTAINYSNRLAWIGMVLVDKAYRGIGVSKLLLTDILRKLESFRSVKLDATPAGQLVYKKFGFQDEYSITRMINSSLKSPQMNYHVNPIEPIHSKDVAAVIKFDEITFGINRMQLLEYLINEYPRKAYLLKQNHNITGFVLGRDGNKYHHIGPVTATTTTEAQMLIAKALTELSDQPVVVDVLNDKKELMNWLELLGFIKQREFTRMYLKENLLQGKVDQQYLICGPEFG